MSVANHPSKHQRGRKPDGIGIDGAEQESSSREPATPTPEGYGTPEEEARVDAEREADEQEPTPEELENLDGELDARGDLAIDTAPRTLTRPHGQNSDVIDADSDEPQGDVNLVSDSIVDASLFDQPSVEGDPHPPRVIADEMQSLDEHQGTSATSPSARESEKAQSRAKLRKTRATDEPGARRGKRSA